jgi:excisionase family DNA binding protein
VSTSRTSPFLSVGKVARMCGVSNRTVLNWIGQGKIEAHALPSGHFRVHVDEVRSFMQANDMELPARISEAAALRDTLCWVRRDLTQGHDCAHCQVLATQAWHCFVARERHGDAAVGCDTPCSGCRYFKSVVRPIGASLELDATACAVSRGGVILGANSQLGALLQRSPADLVGVSWSELAELDDPSALLTSSQDPASVAATRIRRVEGALVRRRGDAHPAVFMVAPFPRMWGALMVRIEVSGQ